MPFRSWLCCCTPYSFFVHSSCELHQTFWDYFLTCETLDGVKTHWYLVHFHTYFPTLIYSWDGAGLQPYLDAAISIILPFADWYYKVQSSLSSGQIITLSLLNGYITFRLYQKTLATESEGQHNLKESVERKHFLPRVVYVLISLNLPCCSHCHCHFCLQTYASFGRCAKSKSLASSYPRSMRSMNCWWNNGGKTMREEYWISIFISRIRTEAKLHHSGPRFVTWHCSRAGKLSLSDPS